MSAKPRRGAAGLPGQMSVRACSGWIGGVGRDHERPIPTGGWPLRADASTSGCSRPLRADASVGAVNFAYRGEMAVSLADVEG